MVVRAEGDGKWGDDVGWVRCCFVAKLCLTLCDPMDWSPPGSSVHGILQRRILEWVAISFSRASSQPRDQTNVSRVVADTLLSEPLFTFDGQNIGASASVSVLPMNLQG